MTKIDPNWKPDPNKSWPDPIATGRTTKMFLSAIELAQEPQTIIMVFPTRSVVDWAYHYFLSIMVSNPEFGPFLPEPRGDGQLPVVRVDPYGTRIAFLHMTNDPGRWLKGRNYRSLSILIDHTVDERYREDRCSALETHYYKQWLEAVNVVQTLAATQPIKFLPNGKQL